MSFPSESKGYKVKDTAKKKERIDKKKPITHLILFGYLFRYCIIFFIQQVWINCGGYNF
jgi:hypothetical protein